MLFGLLLLVFGSPDEGLGPHASLYRELLFIVYAITLHNKQTTQFIMLSIVGHFHIDMPDASWSLRRDRKGSRKNDLQYIARSELRPCLPK